MKYYQNFFMLIFLKRLTIFNFMKKLIFFFIVLSIFCSCTVERKIYVHRHPWNNMNRVHKYYVPRPLKVYQAPSKVYKKEDFKKYFV